jgi:hypothetical protein
MGRRWYGAVVEKVAQVRRSTRHSTLALHSHCTRTALHSHYNTRTALTASLYSY